MDFDFDEECAPVGVFAHKRIDRAKNVLGEPLTGAVVEHHHLVNGWGGRHDGLAQWVVAVEHAGMIELLFEPDADELHPAEIHHEPVLIQAVGTKREAEAPVVAMHQRAMSGMPVLPVGEWDVVIDLGTGDHACRPAFGVRSLGGLTQSANFRTTRAMSKVGKQPWRFWMDTGGTFTDCLALAPDGSSRRLKVLSSGSARARVQRLAASGGIVLDGLPEVGDGFFEGYSIAKASGGDSGRIVRWRASESLATVEGANFLEGDLVDVTAGEEAPVLAMRVLANARLKEPLPAVELRLATTRGTNALLEGKGAKVALFVTEGFADLLRIGDQRRPDLFALEVRKPPPLHGAVVEVAERLAADGSVLRPLDLASLKKQAADVLRAGIDVAAVALLHSYRNDAHEKVVAGALREAGFRFVSASSDLAPLIKIVPRAETAVVDALLSPVMEGYLAGVGKAVEAVRFSVMTSAGGIVSRANYRPKDSLLSGPAGGVAGAAAVARRAGFEKIITFDMGGTSTDVSRIAGEFEYRYQHNVGPARVFAPALRVESVAAGGGSICRFDGAALVVGPESAGAAPGPACYGAGGPLTLTDVNLLLGRLDPALFGLPVFLEDAEARFAEVLAAIGETTGHAPPREEVLRGLLEIADERMADAIRRISVREGYDPSEYALLAFGGAGGLHACAVARRLGVSTVLFPSDSGLLSAFGLRAAVPERFRQRQVLRLWSEVAGEIPGILEELEREAREALVSDGLELERSVVRLAEIEMRFSGQEAGLALAAGPMATIEERFAEAYENRYGYVPSGRALEVVAVRVVASAVAEVSDREVFAGRDEMTGPPGDLPALRSFHRAKLGTSAVIPGNALVQDRFSTLYVAPGWNGIVGSAGSVKLAYETAALKRTGAVRSQVVDLELFTCRFLALVDEMGVLLQRCALSVNVKERFDFSCALLDDKGELVANAPHIPVHLGALGECVRRVRGILELAPGDVAISNHPGCGGSHLPDVTLIAPVFGDDGVLLGFVANRAHHAEMGGVRPGSMPADATCLAEEGVVIAPMLLARAGRTDWERVRQVLSGGSHPSRAVEENIADLHAQLASIRRGAAALQSLARVTGAERVGQFMELLKARSADALGEALAEFSESRYEAVDSLDDGSPIRVACWREGERLIFDFAGSAGVHPGNLNATPAIVRSAVIYVLRMLAGREMPLNEGLMRNVELRIPEGMLSPRFVDDPRRCPAVVGGNVETSQRVVDVLMQALGLAACSQGTMNNTIFGNARFSYYETIGGGSGAGPGFDGCDAVHCHMTNTAITDAEVMELRLPVRLERFSIRRGSGGTGRFRGGDGIERRIRFLEAASLSVLTQRRTSGPPGGSGGLRGSAGEQWIERREGRREAIAGIAGAELRAGDLLVMLTPGGGGWGG